VNTLKQACSRNRAIEKQNLWKERHEQDHGSNTIVSLKSKDGEVHTYNKVPAGADVTQNGINKYADDRVKNAAQKEDLQLRRFCDGQDAAWRPDNFFVEGLGESEDLPPWPMRPTELFTNPHLNVKIMAEQMARQKLLRKAKKMAKKELKAETKGSKKDKKDKKLKKEVKKAKKKLKKAIKKEKKEARREKQGKTSKKPRRETCSSEHEAEKEDKQEQAATEMEGEDSEDDGVEEQAAAEMEEEDSDDDEVEDGEEASFDPDGEGDEVVSVHLSSSEEGTSPLGVIS